MKVDLHVHSHWSDGSLPVAEIVTSAKRLGLERIAITDHDTLAGQEEALAEGERQGVSVIPGIEVSALDPGTGRKVHILGYGIRDAETVNRTCLPYLQDRSRANYEAAALAEQAGYPTDGALASYAGRQGILYRPHIMHALMDRGYESSVYGPLYARLFGPGGLAVVKSRYMSAEEAVRLVCDCGGYAVLAHPFYYDSLGLLPSLVRWGLSGIEALHPTQGPERQRLVREQAEAHGIFLTGGSDFHGLYSEDPVPLGGMAVEIPADHPLARLGCQGGQVSEPARINKRVRELSEL
ncbi:MAG: PHP domain-containing protein [Spirochaetaceae bacterium]|jgi:predicted metal-dependent phosphoesterase TrpH|nr:PHP domain-containing protein [Spirochaetaceae bacterium]